MKHSLTIIATVSPCPPYINEGGKGIDETMFLAQVDSLSNEYKGGLFTVTECPDNYPPNMVMVIDDDTGKVLFAQSIYDATPDGVAAFVNSLATVTYENGVYTTANGQQLQAVDLNGGSNFLGLGLFNLGINLPWWLWLIVGGGSAIQSARSRSKGGKLLWGTVAAIAAGNGINAKNSQ